MQIFFKRSKELPLACSSISLRALSILSAFSLSIWKFGLVPKVLEAPTTKYLPRKFHSEIASRVNHFLNKISIRFKAEEFNY
jgi:hypothetical protein